MCDDFLHLLPQVHESYKYKGSFSVSKEDWIRILNHHDYIVINKISGELNKVYIPSLIFKAKGVDIFGKEWLAWNIP